MESTRIARRCESRPEKARHADKGKLISKYGVGELGGVFGGLWYDTEDDRAASCLIFMDSKGGERVTRDAKSVF